MPACRRRWPVGRVIAYGSRDLETGYAGSPRLIAVNTHGNYGRTSHAYRDVPESSVTQKELASRLGVSERTAKSRTISLQEKELLKRVGGKRNSTWENPLNVKKALER